MLCMQNGLALYYNGVTRSRRSKAPDTQFSARHYWQSSGPKDKRLYQALKSATRSHAVSCRQSCYVYIEFQITCDFNAEIAVFTYTP
jgi:hypothetical protein